MADELEPARRVGPQAHQVVIIGGGVAGCATALALCQLGIADVLVVDCGRNKAPRVGESIPPESQLLLRRLQLWEEFLRERHEPCPGSRSSWGSDTVGYNDFVFNPHGLGWHLDRRRFDAFLVRKVRQCGVAFLAGSRFIHAGRRDDAGFELHVAGNAGPQCIHAQVVVDATGGQSRFARAMGARQLRHDGLLWLGAFLKGPGTGPAPRFTMLEAAEHGWWYAAALPDGRAAVAVVTDAQTNRLQSLHRQVTWLAHLRRTRHLAGWLDGYGLPPCTGTVACPAPSFVLDAVHGVNWLAVGDAASACDPIAAQGICMALRGGVEAAEAISRRLAGQREAFEPYGAAVAQRFADYLQTRNHFYRLEAGRWSSPFWANRQQRRGLSVLETVG